MARRGTFVLAALSVALLSLALLAPLDAVGAQGPPVCGVETITLTGTATPHQEKTYHLEPFRVPRGTARIEVGYRWTPTDQGVLDLGLWDATGTSGPTAFRFWSGSRQGRLDRDMDPVVVAADRNERTVVSRKVMPGTWHAEVGYADVRAPLDWSIEVRCPRGRASAPIAPDQVDPTHVARDEAGWYAGDFHLHAFHSSPDGPTPEEMVTSAVDAGLDIIPVTDYVTPAHWDRLGATQRKHPELLIWPGREVITYFGHMVVLGETPSVVEHRVGYEGITLGAIQRAAEADGALTSIAHPTIFPPDTFGSFCRGCFFQLWDQVDWPSTNLIEVVTEGSVAEIGGTEVPNPFVRTAVETWESLLREGHRLTAVSGSDDKSGAKYGSTITMVRADELSRVGVDAALREGHAYVRGLGKRSEARMDLVATHESDGQEFRMGDTMDSDVGSMLVRVEHAEGLTLAIRRNGTEVERLPITGGDTFQHEVALSRTVDEGPLGTFWGAEVLDTTTYPGSEVPVLIANPVFLADAPRPAAELPTFERPDHTPTGSSSGATKDPKPASSNDSDDGPAWLPWVLMIGVALVGSVAGTRGGRWWATRRARKAGRLPPD